MRYTHWKPANYRKRLNPRHRRPAISPRVCARCWTSGWRNVMQIETRNPLDFLQKLLSSRWLHAGFGVALCLCAVLPSAAFAQGIPALTSTPSAGGGTSYSLPVQTLIMMTALTFIPAVLLMMSGFTRIVIVMSMLRHAMGVQTSPPNQIVVGLSLFLTFFVMSPVIDKVYQDAWVPLSNNQIQFEE